MRLHPKLIDRRKRLLITSGLVLGALILGPLSFTATTSWAGGVSVQSETGELSRNAPYLRHYDQSVSASITSFRSSSPSYSTVADTYYQSYTLAAHEYETALQSAADQYTTNYQTDPAGARGTYLDDFDHAESDFLAATATARNTFISELFGTTGTEKDAFVTQIDTANVAFSQGVHNARNEIVGLQE